MNHKEFFKILVGNPPPEIEFEILIKQRETEQLPDEAVRAYCLDLVKYTKLQDLLLTSAIMRISEIETKLYRYEKGMRLYKKVRKLGFFGKIKYLLSGNTDQKWLYYLKTRGIPEKEAKGLLTYAFANNVLENVKMQVLKTKIKKIIARKIGVNLGFEL